MHIEHTPLEPANKFIARLGVPRGSMSRLAQTKKLWRGWLIQREPVRPGHRIHESQDWEWCALRIGTYNADVGQTQIEVPKAWFVHLSHLKQARSIFETVRELEDDIDTLRGDRGFIRMLEQERGEAFHLSQQAVKGLMSDPLFGNLPVASTRELLSLFDNVHLVPMYEERAPVVQVATDNPFKGLKRALIIGGDVRDHVAQRVSEELGIEEVVWWETFEKLNLRANSGTLEQVKNGKYDIVFVLLRFCRHNQHYAFRDACRESGTALGVLQRGYGVAQFDAAARYALGLEHYVHG